MAKCQKCGLEVDERDLYEAQGLQVCEDCKINSIKFPVNIQLN